MKKVIIWGAGGTGKRVLREVSQIYNVLAVVDSDERKWGGSSTKQRLKLRIQK